MKIEDKALPAGWVIWYLDSRWYPKAPWYLTHENKFCGRFEHYNDASQHARTQAGT